MGACMKFISNKQNLDASFKTDTLVTNRDKILKDLESVEDPNLKPTTNTAKRDLIMLRIRLE